MICGPGSLTHLNVRMHDCGVVNTLLRRQLARCVHQCVAAERLLCMASGHVMQSCQTAALLMRRHATLEEGANIVCTAGWACAGLMRSTQCSADHIMHKDNVLASQREYMLAEQHLEEVGAVAPGLLSRPALVQDAAQRVHVHLDAGFGTLDVTLEQMNSAILTVMNATSAVCATLGTCLNQGATCTCTVVNADPSVQTQGLTMPQDHNTTLNAPQPTLPSSHTP